ncbi:calcium/proton exchanger [cyanobacterium endosymbiont of Epithemia turgida]|uniref:calcium/proton exchanger n=1 Tax=cyanobacterium endosymbiont of Epithemia turgida TaxID=718217 RepID=UPI0004D1B2E0|nr:calcium/proton exchanger [cyanobacterium endosymbiont of Epithemia turgida]BAP18001.1 H+/Ca2+ exchanger [cyanobacterium endosymbiont of Epithemia turgida isolate EtSB Lake Yunoko]
MITKKNLLFLLLLFIPLSFAANYFQWGSKVVFITAALAIVPLAAFMGEVTEAIAVVVGPNLGGLLNATFGNATELILALIALKEGLIGVVKATITGSIIGNLLLVVGCSMLFGGLRYKEQEFQPVAARLNASSMNLAIVAILLPTAVQYTSTGIEKQTLQNFSVAVAIVLITVYILTLIFSMKTHAYLYDVGILEMENRDLSEFSEEYFKKVNIGQWGFLLLLITLGVAIESELLVNSLEEATESLGLTSLFTGIILLPIVSNAAEHTTAVTVAIKDKMDLSMAIAVGSSLQIALFIAPVLVISGWITGKSMDLSFNPFELVVVAVAVLITNSISADGRSNWLEGILLLATYIVIGLAFYFYPVIDGF